MRRVALLILLALALLAGCSDDDGDVSTAEAQRYPDVVSAVASREQPGLWTFTVTVSSPYDSADRYADAWRVLAPDGTVLGERILAHPHADEQPFTRSLSGVQVPAGIRVVSIQARDSENGYGDGARVSVGLTPDAS
jgi:hypothetical protein